MGRSSLMLSTSTKTHLDNAKRSIDRQLDWTVKDVGQQQALFLLDILIEFCQKRKLDVLGEKEIKKKNKTRHGAGKEK